MNVDLNWAVEWGEKTDQQLSRAANGDLKQALGRNGTFSTTTLVLGKGYRNLYERQLQTAFDDISGTSIVDSLGNRDGRSVLELVTLHNDFREAYMGSIGKFALGRYGFGALPLPNWNLTYSGIETMFPVLQDYIARVSLTHAYRGRYRSGYRFNPNVENGNSLAGASSNRLGGFTVFQPLAEHSPDQSALESAFAPLVGLNITWKNQMRTQFDFERSKRITMSYTSARIDETNTRGIKFSVNYEKRGFKLPLMKKLQNTLTATLNFGYAEDLTQRYQLSNDLNRSLTAGDPAFVARDPKLGTIVIDAPTGTGRINGSAVIGYQFSSMITANFEYAYTHIMPRSTNTFERVTQDFRFNIVVAIRGN
jgi:cell surface protein SprA